MQVKFGVWSIYFDGGCLAKEIGKTIIVSKILQIASPL